MFRNMGRIIIRVLSWLARMMFRLATICITSIWVGVPTSVHRIADSWITEATAAGIPLGYHPTVRVCAIVVAYICLLLGWLVLASFTVFILRILF